MSRPILFIERSASREADASPVRAFYRHRSVLVTNPNEFWAKFTIVKLLQTCEITYIYVLLRPKRNKTLQDIYDEYVASDIFSHLRDSDLLQKVIPVAAFLTLPALGLEDRDLKLLLANVSVVFHSTDTSDAKLDRPLKSAANVHLNVTRNVVELASRMNHLVSFVYLSTLNAAYTQGYLEEEVYPLKPYFYKIEADAFWNKIKDMDTKYVEKIKPTFLGKHPNSYSFAMALSENLIWEKREQLRHAAIVRPSCLSAAYSEPDHGWFDGLQLPTSLMTLHAMGITRAVNEDTKKVLPMVPGDMLVNGLLSIAWYMGDKSNANCLVYNFSSEEENGVTVGQIQEYATENFYKYPSTKAIRTPVAPRPQSRLVYQFNQLVSETLFAYFFDFLLICTGKSPMLVDMMAKMHTSMREVSSYYFRDSYAFSVINLKRLLETMSPEDKQTFNCDIRLVNWNRHFDDCYMRFRRHVLREPDSNVSDAIKRVYQLTKVYDTIKFFSLAVLVASTAMSTYYLASWAIF